MSQVSAPRIMVIGTDLHFCYLLRRYVRESDHPLLVASPDEKIVEIIQRDQPALIVLEDGTQDLAGGQILKVLKMNDCTRHIPVVLCSWKDEARNAPEKIADVFLSMPILYKDFLNALSQLGIE